MVRTLHADLTTAQQASSGTPHIVLKFDSFDRGTSRTYTTADSTNRILQVQQAEGRFGSYTLIEGRPFIVSSVIRLNNADAALSGLDFKGYRVYIEWGYTTSSGNKTSRSGPEFVMTQELVSEEGVDYLEMYTINLWEMANQIFVNVGNVFPLEWIRGAGSETKVSHILMELLGGGTLDDVTAEDGGAFTDYTAAAQDTTTTMTVFPATPATNDAFYFGQLLQFDRITIDVTQILSSGSMTVDWEYSKGGSAWGTLSPLTGSTGGTTPAHLGFTSTGIQIEAFDIPSDWAKDTVDSGTSLFFIRARISSTSSPVQAVQALRIFAGKDFGFALDTSTAGQGDDFLPTISTDVGTQLGPLIELVMSFTLMGIRAEEDGFHASFVNNAQASPDVIYDLDDGPHHFFVHTEGQQVVVPNRILVVSSRNLPAPFSGTANDAASQLQIGIIPRIVFDESLTSDAECVTQATRLLAQASRDKVQGRVEVPIDVGAEIWDEARVQDDRTGNNSDGRISQLVKAYQPGQYIMQVIMGGEIWGVGPIVRYTPKQATDPFIPFGPDIPTTPMNVSPFLPRPVPQPVIPPLRIPGRHPAPGSTTDESFITQRQPRPRRPSSVPIPWPQR